ncbi:uncharacterized protein FA14DRAFT_178303 [Meira miltonrushii]|uniref:Uncharacterized protein n=1 Tax=Meira miltonrushii TaxID=1280837 RepID=A0A316VCR0_9BASI|nr:uncharacterized protein FA14DRAFT_178303 [Meira miltonrushii]PWN34908.1 hypothetical protein FA14DRAFT_178303 [Meira miltonrushii]
MGRTVLLACVAYYIRTTQGGRKIRRKSTVSRKTSIGVLSASVAGTLVLLNQVSSTVRLLHLRAYRAKDQDAQQFWLVHLIGLVLVPVTGAINVYITRGPLQGDTGIAWYGAAVGGWSSANFIGSIANIYLTTYARDVITSKKGLRA